MCYGRKNRGFMMTKKGLQEYRSVGQEIRELDGELSKFANIPYERSRTELQRLIRSKCRKLLHQRKQMRDELGRLPERERHIMEARYIKGLPWEEIAREMRYSVQMIHRIHRKALQACAEQ